MARKSPSESVFVLTIPLHCEPWQRDRLDKLFQVCNDIKNNLIAYERKQYQNLIGRREWKHLQNELAAAYQADNEEKLEPLFEKRNAMVKAAGFSKFQFEKQANKYRKHYHREGGKGYLVNTHISQKIAASVWSGFEALLYKNGEEVHFSKWSDFTAITAKSNETGITYHDGKVFVNKMELPVMLDKKDPYGYQREALSQAIRYCGISRRWYANGWKYFVQLTLDGKPPVKIIHETGELLHPMGSGRVGHDIGTQTIASCGANNVLLAELADKVHGIDAELRRINRAMDRSRRATNPKMFREDGSVVPKDKLPTGCLTPKNTRKWEKSKRYLKLEAIRRELYRRQHELRIQQHNELANKLLSFGDEHYIEEMRFRALARRAKETKKNARGKFQRKKRFGKSISNKAPAAFVDILQNKVIRAGGRFHKVDTYFVKASQFNHLSETYTKKSLSQRWNVMPDKKKVQRDLYSAFLIMNVDATLKKSDKHLCNETYPTFLTLHDKEIERVSHLCLPCSAGIKKPA